MPVELDLSFLKDSPAPRLCKAAAWLGTLSDDNVHAVNLALANPEWTTADLYKNLKAAGAKFSLTVLKEHRRGDCSCV